MFEIIGALFTFFSQLLITIYSITYSYCIYFNESYIIILLYGFCYLLIFWPSFSFAVTVAMRRKRRNIKDGAQLC